MQILAPGVHFLDLKFLGRPGAIAAVVLHGAGEVVLLDPGPASTLPVLRQALATAGMGLSDVTAILLTHIHLDHAGAVGVIVREQPAVRVFVHEVGLPHLADPSKLVASASRLYGGLMNTLWGEIAPVPREAMVALKGGDRLKAAGRDLAVAYTPGHASHHVSFFSPDTGIAFVGDTAGVKVAEGMILPPTPPPDIDLELWTESLAIIEGWRPDTLLLTHFGPSVHAAAHLAELRQNMALVADMARRSLSQGDDDASHEGWFVAEVRRELRRRLSDDDAARYETSARFDLNWRGLARYWRKKQP